MWKEKRSLWEGGGGGGGGGGGRELRKGSRNVGGVVRVLRLNNGRRGREKAEKGREKEKRGMEMGESGREKGERHPLYPPR